MRSVSVPALAQETQLSRMSTLDTRPLNEEQPLQQAPLSDIKQCLRLVCTPQCSVFIPIFTGVLLFVMLCVTARALMPGATTTTTTTTTATTLTTTTYTTTTQTSTTRTMSTSTLPSSDAKQVKSAAATSNMLGATTTSTTARSSRTTVSLCMTVQHLDYSRLVASPSVRRSFERRLRQVIAAEASHGVLSDHVHLLLEAGSVVVRATIASLLGDVADAVRDGLRSSQTLGSKVAMSVSEVEGMEAVSTGPIAVTNIEARISGVRLVAAASLSLPAVLALSLTPVFCIAAFVPLAWWLWRRRRADGYAIASNEESRRPKNTERAVAKAGALPAGTHTTATPAPAAPRPAIPTPKAKDPVPKPVVPDPAAAPKAVPSPKQGATPGAVAAPAKAEPPKAQAPATVPAAKRSTRRQAASAEAAVPKHFFAQGSAPEDGAAPRTPRAKAGPAEAAVPKHFFAQGAAQEDGAAPRTPRAQRQSPRPHAAAAQSSQEAGSPRSAAHPDQSQRSGQVTGPEEAQYMQMTVEMGIGYSEARRALRKAGGDTQRAMEQLLNNLQDRSGPT